MTRGLPGQWATAGGWRMHARVWPGPAGAEPQHPPVVLLHGLSLSSTYMVRLGKDLCRDHAVYAPDMPGFGGSQKPPYGLGLDELTEVLKEWLEVMGLVRPVLLGNSAGSQMITLLEARYPGTAAALVLVAPSVDRKRRSAWQQGLRFMLDGTREPPQLLAIVMRDHVRATMRSTLRAAQSLLADRIEERLPRLHLPTLVITGSRDPLVPRAWAAEVTRRLPQGRLKVIKGAAHGVPYTHAAQVAEALRARMRQADANVARPNP